MVVAKVFTISYIRLTIILLVAYYVTHISRHTHKDNVQELSQGKIAFFFYAIAELIICMPPANERRRYKVKPSLIGWAQT